ncbi:nucleotide exchange factor GrpE [Bacillus marinisedimentorum]|uniref:nucleotide exchange factor GrpE n=1 Tax=Bacillus marinisedimentorum TaxID=1821260 RepID=UPI000D08AC54
MEDLQDTSENENTAEAKETARPEGDIAEESEVLEGTESEAEETPSVEMAELQAKLNETTNRMLRIQADFDNHRRRSKTEKETAEKYRAQSLITDLLPALDNFERAMAVEAVSEDAKSLMQGMEMVYRQLNDALVKEGLEEIKAEGEQFDPHYHQAVMQVQEEGYESNQVVEQFQKGYKLKDRVIRPAMVKVNQ